MMAFRRKPLTALICLALGTPFQNGFAAQASEDSALCAPEDEGCHSRVRGRMIDDASSYAAEPPPSSEAESATLAASGLSPSDLRRMRAAAAQPSPQTGQSGAAAQPPATVAVQIDDAAQAGFRSGSAELTESAKAALDALAARLSDIQIRNVRVVGHTDNQRIGVPLRSVYASNQALSEARAAAVAGYLMRKLGLAADKFAISGQGDSAPLASNATPEGMARNRRVQIEVWGAQRVAAPVPAVPVAPPVAAPVSQSLCGGETQPAVDPAAPFLVSVDGAPLGAQAPSEADRQRCVDVALAKDQVQVRYDPLQLTPALNAWAVPNGAERGQPVTFRTWTNYAAWIKRAEIRIYAQEPAPDTAPLAVLPVALGAATQWTAPVDAPSQLYYLVRVEDAQGRFDQTLPKPLTLVTHRTAHADLQSAKREAEIGYGKNNRAIANIPVQGGTVTINGRAPSEKAAVTALGSQIPVGREGKFVTQQILPVGSHAVVVRIDDPAAAEPETTYRRNIVIPQTAWFGVAVADLTVGHGSGSAHATLVDPTLTNEVKNGFADGRLAFYTKGAFANGYRLTASADTREQPLADLFSNFARKDPRYLLRRIDSDQYYPVYGDDSTALDDAPTQGKFYVKVEKDDNSVMWGNFITAWSGSDLTQYSRGLYGANALWKSAATTTQGERSTSVNAFAADPGTVGARDDFRGTGGSLYYLRRQDVTVGSERVWVEVRDRNSDLVLQRVLLVPGSDYDLSYLQGRLLLNQPLSSVADGAGLVRNGSLSGNPQYLVVTYEFVPGMTEVDQLATGLRAEHWFNDHVRLGLTNYHQAGDGIGQTLSGLDATLRYKPGTWLRAEVARSKGAGAGTLSSIDGGFDFASRQVAPGSRADAKKIEAEVALADLREGLGGKLGAYWKDREAGYSAPGQIAIGGEAVIQRGARAEVPVGNDTQVSLKIDQRLASSQDTKLAEAEVRQEVTPNWTASVAVRAEDRGVADTALILSPILAENGNRTDAAAKLDYHPAAEPGGSGLAPWNVYGFGQKTLNRTGTRSENDRVGAGGGWQATDRLRLNAEVSDGDGGVGGKLGSDYRVDDRNNVYLQYLMETQRPDQLYSGRFGTLLVGSRSKLNDRVSLYEETRRTTGTGQAGLLHAFGVDLVPTERWSVGLKMEAGTLSDPLNGDLKRRAAAVSLGYKDNDTVYASSLEYRRDQSNLTGGRTSWLTRNSFGQQLTAAWRLLGKLDLARSSASQGAFFDGDYTEGVIGAAYRPVDNDRWNTLIKYTYFYDLPSPGQLSPSSGVQTTTVADYSQRSQVLSADTIWDANDWLSLGAKLGYRWSSLRPSRDAGDWFSSSASLVVLRGEWHFVREWSGLVEWRRLHAKEAGDTQSGALLAVYRRMNEHVKMGVGYNFTNFSDNLTDLSYNNRGVFLNVLATY